jgi:hypothetical protein
VSSIKCPHCGLVNFATAETCKRCNQDVRAPGEFKSAPVSAPETASSFRFQGDNPAITWVITLVLLIPNLFLSYAVALKTSNNPAELFGGVIGGLIAWPLILGVLYGLLRSFRERHSFHAVINYGMGMNVIVMTFMSLR